MIKSYKTMRYGKGPMVYPIVKRVWDVLLAVIGGILFFPFGLIVAILIKIESKGSVFFRQNRVGMDCKIFSIFKFRTMRIETEMIGKPLSDMQRMTKIGNFLRRTSLDEIPQILNIIKGDMSFIGPRPLLVEYIPRYTEYQMRRHEVKPGISGWAQVNGRNAIEWAEKFAYDVWYVDHMSFKTDFRILLFTIKVIIQKSGVNQSNQETMMTFIGNEHDRRTL